MAHHKRRIRNSIIRDMSPTFLMAGGAMGASILGGALSSHLPAGVSNPLTTTGSTLGKFVGPMAAISSGGIVMKQLKGGLKRRRR